MELDKRMKRYEDVERKYLMKKTPVIIRLDGIAFKNFTKGMILPFDEIFRNSMWESARILCSEIQGCKLGYTFSDEISLLLTDYDRKETESWLDYNVQKMVSTSSSKLTRIFNKVFEEKVNEFEGKIKNQDIKYEMAKVIGFEPEQLGFKSNLNTEYEKALELLEVYKKKLFKAEFDSRAFNLPKDEVNNYFIFRQQDGVRNSISTIGRTYLSHKSLQFLNSESISDKLLSEKGIDINKYATRYKEGVCIFRNTYEKEGVERRRWEVDTTIPLFKNEKEYVEKYVY